MLVGTFMAFDRHMNMVLGDTEEYRRIKSKKGQGLQEERTEKRTLGLIILRGDSVVSLTIEGPPPPEGDEKLTPGGPGVGRAVGRGLPVAPMGGAPMGLAGPVRGVGGPSPSMMQPPVQGMEPQLGPFRYFHSFSSFILQAVDCQFLYCSFSISSFLIWALDFTFAISFSS